MARTKTRGSKQVTKRATNVRSGGDFTQPLEIVLDIQVDPEGRTSRLTSAKVNGIELVGRTKRRGALLSLVRALLGRKLGEEIIVVEEGTYSHQLWEAVRRPQPRVIWAKALSRQNLLRQIVETQGSDRVVLKAPAASIHVLRNHFEVSDTLSLRDLYRRVAGQPGVASDVAAIERVSEILNNHERSKAAVAMLKEARKIQNLTDTDYMWLTAAYAKHLGHLGRHDAAIEVLTKTFTELEVAAAGDDPNPKFRLPFDAKPGVWYIDASLIVDDKFDVFSLAVLRGIYQLGIAMRRKNLFDVARAEFEHILSFSDELAAKGKGLLRMAKHQQYRIYEQEMLARSHCDDVFGLVKRGIRANSEDRSQLGVLKQLKTEWEEQEPGDLQRIGFAHQRLGLLWYFIGNSDYAVEHLNIAIDRFDQASDQRNLVATQEMLEKVKLPG
jgi:tetratricopeptide (TPR) repeat protein